MADTIQVRKGTKFFAAHKDSTPEWEVLLITESGYAECVVISPDWKGETRVYTKDEISAVIWRGRAFDRMNLSQNGYWERQHVGDIIHYHNSFGKFVRLEVVLDGEGKKSGKPIALVGKWDRSDLPRRNPDGEIYYPHSAKSVVTGELHRYPMDSMWEGGLSDHYRNLHGDPTDMVAIDLTVDDMTPAQQEEARLTLLLKEISEIIQDGRMNRTPSIALDRIRAIL
jgi:hypothetical protein